MGAWLEFPEIDYYIQKRVTNKCRRTMNRDLHIRRCDLFVQYDPRDIANKNDVMEAPLWECEVPITPDGY